MAGEKRKNNHLMIDLETMSNVPGGVITSIGAVFFNPLDDWSEAFPDDLKVFYKNIDINSCLKAGMTVEGDTIHWWLGQGEEAKKALTDPKPEKVDKVLWDFSKWYWNQRDTLLPDKNIYVWSHGLTFDIPFIMVAAQKLNRRVPWMFQNCRDTRTLFDLAYGGKMGKFKGFDEFDKHNSLHDAINQVLYVQEAYRALNIGDDGYGRSKETKE